MFYVMSKSYVVYHLEAVCETLAMARQIRKELSDENNIDTFFIFEHKE